MYSHGETVVLDLRLYNASAESAFVGRPQRDDFVRVKITGPDGNAIPWRGSETAESAAPSSSDFTVLEKYHEISAKRVLSLKDGAGFAFDKPGQYTITAEYFLGPTGSFESFAGQTKIVAGPLRSTKAEFCIEACILEPLPVRNNRSKSALEAVRAFYSYVTTHGQLGIPSGHARKVLRPLMSKRLAQELDSLQVCDDDYYRRYGEILRANQDKPETPWLEEGLFTGPNDAATPFAFRLLGSRAIGDDRVDIELRFTTEQTYVELPPSYDHFEGVVTVILQNKRWVVDDYVALYENDELLRLSTGYPECRGGQWVGEKSY